MDVIICHNHKHKWQTGGRQWLTAEKAEVTLRMTLRRICGATSSHLVACELVTIAGKP